MFHITNGESVVISFRDGGVPGHYLSWDDSLIDGPVPSTPTLEELSLVRAKALSGFGWGNLDAVRSKFQARDHAISGFREHDEVVLWFEHDLYDQLQLLQILDWFSDRELGGTALTMVQIDKFPGIEPFYGLGQLTGGQLASLIPTRKAVTANQLRVARECWAAFRAPDPSGLAECARQDFPEMPFLRNALNRVLEEYPSVLNGLSRTQQQILMAVESGSSGKREIYAASRKLESTPWGDASVFLRIDALASGPMPALERYSEDAFRLTDTARRLLAGQRDWIDVSGGADTWIGGVHLSGATAAWRWDPDCWTLASQ